jgi:hypothetical protein
MQGTSPVTTNHLVTRGLLHPSGSETVCDATFWGTYWVCVIHQLALAYWTKKQFAGATLTSKKDGEVREFNTVQYFGADQIVLRVRAEISVYPCLEIEKVSTEQS